MGLVGLSFSALAQVPLEVEVFEQKLSATPSAQLLDVRTTEEFQQGHLPQALHMNYRSADFMQQINQLDKSKPVFVYCLSGGRSAAAAQKLVAEGFKDVYDMQGGYLKWQAAGKPTADATASTKATGMSEEAFQQLIASEQPVLIDFYALWCAPCQKMLPSIKKLTKEYEGRASIKTIHYDQNKTLAQQLQISEIPVLLLYQKGELRWRGMGYLSEKELREVLDKYL